MAARHQQSTGLPESSRGQSGAGKVQIIPISSLLRAFFLPSWGDFFCRESVNFGAEQTTLQRYNESIAVYAFFTKNFKNQKSPYLTALSSYLLVLTSQFLALSSQLLVLSSYFLVLTSNHVISVIMSFGQNHFWDVKIGTINIIIFFIL